LKTLFIVLTGFVLSAGASSAQQQIANPAAVFCIEQGGDYEIVQESEGARGDCILADGTRIDAWQFYRESQVVDTPRQRMANPAAVFCVEQGGAYRIVTSDSGDQYGECVIMVERVVDAWQFYRENH